MAQVDVRVTTLGSQGRRDRRPRPRAGARPGRQGARQGSTRPASATRFRGGFLTARDWGLSWERSAQVGSLLATMVLETVGTQEYAVEPADFAERLAESYGDDCAAEVEPYLST